MSRVIRLAVLVSGAGTTLEGLAEKIEGGLLPASVVLVVADRPNAPALELARRRGLPTAVLPVRGIRADRWAADLDRELGARQAELVLLAGFLSVVPAEWLVRWEGRVLNVHPSLLPKYGGRGFYGRHVHEAVLRAGDAETGATVHWVTNAVDGGPVVAQARIAVLPGDTPESLRARLHPLEVELIATTIRRIADGEVPMPYPVARDRPARRAGRGSAG